MLLLKPGSAVSALDTGGWGRVRNKMNWVMSCKFLPDFEMHQWINIQSHTYMTIPIGSMYAIYGNIYHQYTPNVSIYTIHGSYGYMIVYLVNIISMHQYIFPTVTATAWRTPLSTAQVFLLCRKTWPPENPGNLNGSQRLLSPMGIYLNGWMVIISMDRW